MKARIVLLLLINLACCGVFAQVKATSSDKMKINIRGNVKEIVENNTDENGTTKIIYRFNPEGLITSIEYPAKNEKISYIYNADKSVARITSNMAETWYGAGLSEFFLFEFPYYKPHVYKTSIYTGKSDETFEYINGYLAKHLNKSGGETYISTYNNNGILTKIAFYNSRGKCYRNQYFDLKGNCTKDDWAELNETCDTGPGNAPTERYDSQKRIIYLKGDWYEEKIKYNAQGFIAEKIEKIDEVGSDDADNPIITTYTNYQYDDKGNWTKRTRKRTEYETHTTNTTRHITYYPTKLTISIADVSKTNNKDDIDIAELTEKKQTVEKKPASTKPLEKAEQMPSYKGGESAMMRFIAENLKYPVIASENGVQGRVVLRFVVSSAGKIEDVQVVRSLDPSCDREAVRVIKAMPDWNPGIQDGVPVNVYFTLPVAFRLSR